MEMGSFGIIKVSVLVHVLCIMAPAFFSLIRIKTLLRSNWAIIKSYIRERHTH